MRRARVRPVGPDEEMDHSSPVGTEEEADDAMHAT